MALANESSPCFLPGACQVLAATFSANPKIERRFKTGKGLGWDQHDHPLFEGTERFFRPNYLGNLVANWIPSLDGMDVAAAKHVKKTLAQDDTWMIVEPVANDLVEDNLNPVGRVFFAASR